MDIISSYQLKKGKVAKPDLTGLYNYQPLQFLPDKEKDDEWAAQNINFIDWQGLDQIRRRASWMMTNYKLCIGDIEVAHYMKTKDSEPQESNEMLDILERNANRPLEAMKLKNYPLANTVYNILKDEHSKRISHITFGDRSDIGTNEMLDEKKQEIEDVLLQQAAIKQQMKMMQMGLSADSKEGQQMMDPSTLKSLPQIQDFYTKSYRNIYQEWAEHQKMYDEDRFSMRELEDIQFGNMLAVDREFWHWKMYESDYELEVWNPPQVAYRKSPSTHYMSDATWIIHIDYLTIPDVIDREGWKMSEEQLLSLNTIHGARSSQYALAGKDHDQYWDASKSYEWNRTGPGLGMRQAMSVLDNVTGHGGDVVREILNEGEDPVTFNGEFDVRVSTVYWKTQRKYYHLTRIDEEGNPISDIVGEDYKVTTKPQYNTVLYKEKTKENLIFGEHLDPLWANEVWGGIRIGNNIPSVGWNSTEATFAPMYIGINGPKPTRLPFQFKGDKNTYGCKLPVEGRVFNDYNNKSKSLMDNLKCFVIGQNMALNLAQDVMVNDLGIIMQIDPNAIPKHSEGEDWGLDQMAATLAVIKETSILPAYSAGKNADGIHIGVRPIERVDLSQISRVESLLKIGAWYKTEGLNSVGLNPERVGTPIDKEDTATGVNQAVAASFSHTEYLFTQHDDYLMPRVWAMDINLAQYYNSTNPSLRLQYITSNDEKAFFQIDGTKLLGRDFNAIPKTTVNYRKILQDVKQLLLTNNTSKANIYDLARGIQIPTLTEIRQFMDKLEKKQDTERQQQMDQEQQQHEQEQQMQMQLLQEKQQFEATENEKDRQAKIYEAEIMAASRAAMTRPPEEGEAAYQEGLDRIQAQDNFQQTMNLNREKHLADQNNKQQQLTLAQQKIMAEQNRTKQQLEAAKLAAKVKEKNSKNTKK